ncbi:MAG: hypothetical protein Q7S58_01640 [Candidatus Binatus sp.]|uniref:hypothetical protein n=1 Tax=Candidatus Binatus sp. TaxID=2811406 RepID=UPI002719B078|nr:hypothetical protein [Candidatus Binatus sp.]MDO8431092.1 hypothetical protein [Candidatus Binatus sp.]
MHVASAEKSCDALLMISFAPKLRTISALSSLETVPITGGTRDLNRRDTYSAGRATPEKS